MGFFKLNIEKMAKNKDIKGLAKALMDRKDLDVRNDAMYALDDMKDIDKIADSQFAEMLVNAICETFRPLPKLDPQLQTKLKNSDRFVRFTADRILLKMGDAVLEPMVKAVSGDLENLDYSQKMEIRYSLATVINFKEDTLPPEIINKLLSALNSKDETVVRWSAIALSSSKKDNVIDALIGLLRSPATFHLGEVAEALAHLKDRRAIDPLIEAVNQGASEPKFSKALADLGDPKAVEPLLNALKKYIKRDDDYNQKPKSLIYDISRFKDKRAIEPFIAFLSHQSNYEKESEWTRYALARALGDIGDDRVVLVLLRTLNTDPNNIVRRSAIDALGELAKRGQLGSMVEIVRIGLESASSVGSEDDRNAALKALALLPKKVEIVPVIKETPMTENHEALLEEQLSEIISDYEEFAMIEEIAKLLVDFDRKSNKEYNVNQEAYKTTLKSIKHIGSKLDDVGGMQLMIKVLTQAGQYGCNTRFVEREWNGIGSWRG